jgi:hypothetical protein
LRRPSKLFNRNLKSTGKSYQTVAFSTLSSPVFTEYRETFYPNGVKTVPLDIGDLLTARYPAYWAMDDGTKQRSGFVLCTESYTLEVGCTVARANFEREVRRTPEKPSWGQFPDFTSWGELAGRLATGGGFTPVARFLDRTCNVQKRMVRV